MWSSSWTKGITEALEKTGEAISQAEKKASKGLTEALEKTGDAITQAATKATHREPATTAEGAEEEGEQHASHSMVNLDINKAKMLKNLQMGWSSVVEGTKQAVEATKEAVELERSRLEQNFLRKGFYKRDPKLPLDVEALRDAEVVYVTDRILTMSHPAMASSVNPSITAGRKLAAVGHLLQRRHDGRFLVWNLSEVDYDISVLDDQVLTFSFPGSPSPPLGLLLKLLISMENWMKADDRNVAVVHCLTGKGRTSTVLAAFLCWMGEAGFGDINKALDYIAKCKQIPTEELTIPSQRRYASYFKNMLDGVRPSQPPLLLKRIIMSEAPKFAKGPTRENMKESPEDEKKLMGCAPYLQIFKGGKLIFTTAATLHVQQADEELPFVQVIDGTVPFNIEEVIQGDILIRCRHLTFNKQRVSMFRAAFHTGYVPPNVLRLTKSQLDGACADRRYPDDFFLDLIFEKVDSETATKHLEEQAEEDDDHGESPKKEGKGPVVKASNYDAMLQGDSRFWDVINSRRQEHTSRKNDDPLWGPTVGRRRGEGTKKEEDGGAKTGTDSASKQQTPFDTFSIGNEFDFLPVEPATAAVSKPVEKDSLMEALHALDEDEVETEEVVFDDSDAPKSESTISAETPLDSSNAVAKSETDASEATPNETDTPTHESDKTIVPKQTTPTPVPSQPSSTDDGLEDMDALLADADEDLGDMNLEDFDDDDEDLEDLEAMLNS